MGTIQAVLFDLDDTLLESRSIKWQQHMAIARERYAIDLSEDTIREHWGKPFTAMLEGFYVGHPTPVGILDAYRDTATQFQKGLYPAGLSTVRHLLREGIEVGIVTSAPTGNAIDDLIRHQFPVDDLLMVQGEDGHHAHKPDPTVFDPALKLLEAEGIQRDAVLYVGDSIIDLEAAKAAELKFFGVATGLYEEDVFVQGGADGVGADVGELIAWLANV